MRDLLPPPLRLTILSSPAKEARARATALEAVLDGTAAGIGWDLGALESPAPGVELLGERLEMRVFSCTPAVSAEDWLDATLHSVVVVLVDEDLLRDKEAMAWLHACAEHVQADTQRHSLLAIPFSEACERRWIRASPAIGDLQTLPWSQLAPEPAGRLDQLAMQILNRMIRTITRALSTDRDPRLRIFISHAKQDGFQLAQSLRHYLGEQPWLESFYDARDIQPGESWKAALRDGVAQSLLLVIRTDAYDQRFWCRQEVRWAELFGVPRVVIDARSGLVHPGNDLGLEAAPTVRVPDGNLARALFAALQTVLRSFVFQRRVAALRERPPLAGGDVRVLPVMPSIATLNHALRQGPTPETTVERWLIYPDPPLGEGTRAAAKVLARAAKVHLRTPSQLHHGAPAVDPQRSGMRVGVSVGSSAELPSHGFTRAATNRFTVRLTRALLAEEMTLAFGHDWRPGGIMEAITGIALDLQVVDADSSEPTILNLLPWPRERSAADRQMLSRLEGLVEVRPVGLPNGVEDLCAQVKSIGSVAARAYLQARGLTHMRRALVAATGARVAIGGKLSGYTGRIPGIVEEVLLSLDAGQPVYIAGLLGGAARLLGHVLLEGADPTPLWKGVALADRYRQVTPASDDGLGDAALDTAAWDQKLKADSTRDLLLTNGLDEDENRLLLRTTLEEEVIELVRAGLQRVPPFRRRIRVV